MKKRTVKIVLIGLMMLVAGIAYSCGGTVDLENGSHVSDDTEAAECETEIPEEVTGAEISETDHEKCMVYVCGQVSCPDVYELDSGSIISDAVKAAGGFTEEADRNYVNLAERVYDGEKIYVPSSDETAGCGISAQAYSDLGDSQSGSGKVNINTASAEELMMLKGIGEARAGDIIEYRQTQGQFGTIEDIMKVPGIKEGAFEKIKDDITV